MSIAASSTNLGSIWRLPFLLAALVALNACVGSAGETKSELNASDYDLRAVSNVDELVVLEAPDSEAEVVTLPATTAFESARVLLVKQVTNDWVEVFLPIRPNGSTGWVRSTEVTLDPISESVSVNLESRTITIEASGETLLRTMSAVGTEENPTPEGLFYITDKVFSDDPDGAYGPFAFGLSGYSETISEFAGGPGQIGLHGTNMPESIGKEASFGCIRIDNEQVLQLSERLPLGTPVYIW